MLVTIIFSGFAAGMVLSAGFGFIGLAVRYGKSLFELFGR